MGSQRSLVKNRQTLQGTGTSRHKQESTGTELVNSVVQTVRLVDESSLLQRPCSTEVSPPLVLSDQKQTTLAATNLSRIRGHV